MAKKAAAPKVKKDPTGGTKVTKDFVFKLTEAEFAEKGRNAAALAGEVAELELQFAEVKENHKAKIQAREAARDEALAIIRAKEETRTVDAILIKNFDEKEIQYFYAGEVIESRTMTYDELQDEFDVAPKTGRAKKQSIKDSTQNLSGMTAQEEKDEDIKNVIKLETNRATKRSSVDPAVDF
jgi:hypothetical protein